MIGSTRNLSVWAMTCPTDMRKGYDGLCALVSQELDRDPLSGDVFLFVSRSRKRCKALLWDGTGLCIYQKRLEGRRFACLWRVGPERELSLTISELQLFLEGSTLVGKIALSPPKYSARKAASSLEARAAR